MREILRDRHHTSGSRKQYPHFSGTPIRKSLSRPTRTSGLHDSIRRRRSISPAFFLAAKWLADGPKTPATGLGVSEESSEDSESYNGGPCRDRTYDQEIKGRKGRSPRLKHTLSATSQVLALTHAKRADLAANDGRDLIRLRRSDMALVLTTAR